MEGRKYVLTSFIAIFATPESLYQACITCISIYFRIAMPLLEIAMSFSLANWTTNWQKDGRFSKNYTSVLIEKACRLDSQLNNAYCSGTLKVIAGPHRKAGPGEGGDARWHMTLQPSANSSCWHIILDNSVTRPVKINKRELTGHGF